MGTERQLWWTTRHRLSRQHVWSTQYHSMTYCQIKTITAINYLESSWNTLSSGPQRTSPQWTINTAMRLFFSTDWFQHLRQALHKSWLIPRWLNAFGQYFQGINGHLIKYLRVDIKNTGIKWNRPVLNAPTRARENAVSFFLGPVSLSQSNEQSRVQETNRNNIKKVCKWLYGKVGFPMFSCIAMAQLRPWDQPFSSLRVRWCLSAQTRRKPSGMLRKNIWALDLGGEMNSSNIQHHTTHQNHCHAQVELPKTFSHPAAT